MDAIDGVTSVGGSQAPPSGTNAVSTSNPTQPQPTAEQPTSSATEDTVILSAGAVSALNGDDTDDADPAEQIYSRSIAAAWMSQPEGDETTQVEGVSGATTENGPVTVAENTIPRSPEDVKSASTAQVDAWAREIQDQHTNDGGLYTTFTPDGQMVWADAYQKGQIVPVQPAEYQTMLSSSIPMAFTHDVWQADMHYGDVRSNFNDAYNETQTRLQKLAAAEADLGRFLSDDEKARARAGILGKDWDQLQAKLENAGAAYAKAANDPMFSSVQMARYSENDQAKVFNELFNAAETKAGRATADALVKGVLDTADGSKPADGLVKRFLDLVPSRKDNSFDKNVLVGGFTAVLGSGMLLDCKGAEAANVIENFYKVFGTPAKDGTQSMPDALDIFRKLSTADTAQEAAKLRGDLADKISGIKSQPVGAALTALMFVADTKNISDHKWGELGPDATLIGTTLKDGGDFSRDVAGVLAKMAKKTAAAPEASTGVRAALVSKTFGKVLSVAGAGIAGVNAVMNFNDGKWGQMSGDILAAVGYGAMAITGATGVGFVAGLGLVAVGELVKALSNAIDTENARWDYYVAGCGPEARNDEKMQALINRGPAFRDMIAAKAKDTGRSPWDVLVEELDREYWARPRPTPCPGPAYR